MLFLSFSDVNTMLSWKLLIVVSIRSLYPFFMKHTVSSTYISSKIYVCQKALEPIYFELDHEDTSHERTEW